MKRIRLMLWRFKKFITSLFTYPVKTIAAGIPLEYDEYWEERRGEKNFSALNSWQEERASLVSRYLSQEKEVGVSDIGSGPGNLLLYIKNHSVLSNARAYDVSPKAISGCREAGLEAELSDVTDIEALKKIPENDYFLLFEILEHIPNAEMMLKVIYERAQRGVFLSTPNTGYLRHRLRLMLGRFPLQWRRIPGEHLRFWTLVDMKWWLRAQGYDKVTIHPYQGIPILNKVWPNLFAAGILVYIEKTLEK